MSEPKYKSVSVGFQVSAETNKLLTEAAERSRRPKAKEAELRLTDHLINFPDIATPGRRFGHQKDSQK
ncbi:TraY domain-containing protein [Serratia sp. JSRIV006]|uniref:TraY domain-containing protein n=1 Tax=Serratia sp. JSRIV006 TaxID=2831896 RepID=UPI00352FF955